MHMMDRVPYLDSEGEGSAVEGGAWRMDHVPFSKPLGTRFGEKKKLVGSSAGEIKWCFQKGCCVICVSVT